MLADDTTDVIINGHLFESMGGGGDGHCEDTVPNCLTPVSIPVGDLVNGTNTIEFDVLQAGTGAPGVDPEGLDFDGSISSVPEPSTLLMLGTGSIGSAGALFRKMRG